MVGRTSLVGTSAVAAAALLVAALGTASRGAADEPAGDRLTFFDASGVHQTVTTAGSFDMTNPFFQSLGTNGRSCATCHVAADGWTVTPADIQRRFNLTGGFDPIFRTNDGSTCEAADVSTPSKRRRAFSLLMDKGLFRIAMSVPSNAEFEIVDVDDPYHCGGLFTEASLYRRPLPATNLRFLSAVMWDGRETAPGQSIRFDLKSQALDATTGHAQGAPPSDAQLDQIVDFESALYTAQAVDWAAGALTAAGASGGPAALSLQPFCIGINDPLGILPAVPGACATASTGLDPQVFTLFGPWGADRRVVREAVARGEQLFNTRQFVIDDVPGLNGAPQDPVQGPIQQGTCTICHNSPNAGDHSIALPLDLGVASASHRTPDLPLYTLQNTTTGDTVQTTDPGRAMVTGRWADIGKFKGPTLRALATRAPYFHNGAAATLGDVVDFYDTRFHIGFTAREKSDLIAFLRTL